MLSSRKELFRPPTVLDKLSFLQTLLEVDEVNEDIGLALLKVIHKELSVARVGERAAYRRYAAAIESIRYHKADVLKQIVDAWNTTQSGIPAEWFSNSTSSGD